MPTTLTHSYIADIIFDGLDERLKEILAEYKKEYKAGALGPDILMGLLLDGDPALKSSGDVLHEAQVFSALCNTANYLVKHRDDKKMLAYFLGFLTHYAADSTIHPYVYDYIENRLTKKYDPVLMSCLHAIVESEMDAFVGQVYLKGKKADSFYLYSRKKSVRYAMVKFFTEINKDIFGIALNKGDINKAYFLMKIAMLICHRNKNGTVRFKIMNFLDKYLKADHLLMSILRPRHLDGYRDYLNMEKTPFPAVYRYKDSETVNYTFPQMVELSKSKGIYLIRKAFAQIDGGGVMDISDFKLTYNGEMNPEYVRAKEEGLAE